MEQLQKQLPNDAMQRTKRAEAGTFSMMRCRHSSAFRR
jgi:hypothetical protein